MPTNHLELVPENLSHACNPNELEFETTDELVPLLGTAGQRRAVSSIVFGLDMDAYGYNMYVSGAVGTGRNTTVKSYVETVAKSEPVPPDWCYVYNFLDPYRPATISLPAGTGTQLAKDMDEVLEASKREIPRAFESENYERRRDEVLSELHKQREALSVNLQQDAQKKGFAIEVTPIGIVTIPNVDGKPLSREQFEALPEPLKEELRKKSEELQEEIRQDLAKSRKLEKDAAERIRELDKEIALFAVGHLLEDLRDKYKQFPRVEEYLRHVQDDIIHHLEDFRAGEKEEAAAIPGLDHGARDATFDRYKVNVLVNNAATQGAPVVVEHNPTYYNLFGRIDYRARLGAIFTDFNMIKAGDIHRANGGYLVLQARDLLLSFLSWDTLKRTLRAREARIENIGEQFSVFPSATLKPEPIPIDVKVVVVGHPMIYYLLYHLDEDFSKLFKVKVDFDSEMDRTTDNIYNYGAFVAARCKEAGLRPFHKSGVARVVDYGSRLLEHQSKLSTKFAEIADIVTEASYWAEKDDSAQVMAQHVDQAVEKKEYRSNLVEEKIRQLIREGTIYIDATGAVPGQINGLSVIDLGDYYFGRPNRITAMTSAGAAGLINIEREARLSGRIHNKGMMILGGYLAAKFAQDKPLSLSATITFEQSYEEVEGDSASSTELYCLLSSLSDLPLKQNIAVTGSVNQKGEIQPIGGVNKKIEGFFAVCKEKGLTGDQGVIIPAANAKNLMLRQEVVQAVRDGLFHIYAVKTVEEGIELLTGVPAGALKKDGRYPEGTVYYLVDKRLREYAQRLKEFQRRPAPAPVKELKEEEGGIAASH
ncbi:MAG: AAA family ATPase [Chloroflexi bacterium]|nr:AAA family ATPase [Chloroflexota bacterium]